MVISNDGATGDQLVSATAPDFDKVEMHKSTMEDGVMKMMPVSAIEVPAGDAAVLEPGGLHMMLFGARKSFKAGDMFPLHLIFARSGEVTIDVMIDKLGTGEHKHNMGDQSGSTTPSN